MPLGVVLAVDGLDGLRLVLEGAGGNPNVREGVGLGLLVLVADQEDAQGLLGASAHVILVGGVKQLDANGFTRWIIWTEAH